MISLQDVCTMYMYTHILVKFVSFPSPTGSGPENSFEARMLGNGNTKFYMNIDQSL